ncbi:AraC family transcriptional regulator [Flavisolibacter sp. BT320]|nr:AraC family transcriptional regulator [Flavisolibacter longurius]
MKKAEDTLIFLHSFSSAREMEALPCEGFFLVHWISADQPGVDSDTLYLVPPYYVYHPEEERQKGQVLCFSKEFLSLEPQEFSLDIFQLFRKQDALASFRPGAQQAAELQNILVILAAELKNGDNFLLVRTLLKAFLLKLIGATTKSFTASNLNEKRVHGFISLLEKNYLTERNVGFYAASLNVSTKRLNEILKRKYNRTIHQIIHDRLVREAKHQLFISKKNIKEIAFDLGFEDKSYFSRFFKKMTGQTPEAFKKGIDQKVFQT